jgi:hypothetical protein
LRQPLRLRRHSVALATLLVLTLPAAALAAEGVEPKTVSVTLTPGASTTVNKVVHTPPIVPKPDIYFLADTTGSMTPAIANVKANAADILSTVDSQASDPMYGAGDYKDFPIPTGSYAFNNPAPIGAAATAAAAINAWSAGGGADGPEGQLFALHQLATGAAGFRADSTRIVVWFGDAPGHDPVCDAINPGVGDLTEASVTAELVAAGIKVIAVSTTTGGYANGLDDDPMLGASDYNAACGPPGGTPGQASRIATATGGTFFPAVDASQVSAKILEGLQNLPIEVKPSVACDPGLSATFDAASKTVTSGQDATFTETITLAADAPAGHLDCTVDFLLNGKPAGEAFVQTVTVNRPPDCSKLTADKTSLWPPNHKFVIVTLSGATDADGDPITTSVTGVTQDEPLNGLGDGDTAPDAAAVAGHPEQVKLRAERSGTGDGRVYRTAVSVSAGADTCTKTVVVGVPHDQSGPPAIDSGLVVNSFGP